MLKKLVLLGLAGYGAFLGLQQLDASRGGGNEPLYPLPYVVVYGREACGLTQGMKRELTRGRVPFRYEIIDDRSVADRVHSRMENAGISTRRYRLPVVDVSGRLFVSPKAGEVISEYTRSRS